MTFSSCELNKDDVIGTYTNYSYEQKIDLSKIMTNKSNRILNHTRRANISRKHKAFSIQAKSTTSLDKENKDLFAEIIYYPYDIVPSV